MFIVVLTYMTQCTFSTSRISYPFYTEALLIPTVVDRVELQKLDPCPSLRYRNANAYGVSGYNNLEFVDRSLTV